YSAPCKCRGASMALTPCRPSRTPSSDGAARCESYSTVWPIARQASISPREPRLERRDTDEFGRTSQRAEGSGVMLDATSTGMLIDAQSISKAFQAGDETVYALRDVSFGIGKGEFVSLLGPSGCGKTTLMMILVGLINSDAGEARIEGHRVS